jgi:class 3 adenylate cyclase
MILNELRNFSLIILTVLPSFLLGQETINKDLNNNDEVFFNELSSTIKGASWSNYDTTLAQLNDAIYRFDLKKDSCSLSYLYALKARFQWAEGKTDSSLYSFIQASKFDSPTCPDSNQYYLYNSWTIFYLYVGETALGDSVSTIALQAAQDGELKEYELNVLTNRAILFSNDGQTDRAISIMKRIQVEGEQHGFQYHIRSSLQNLGAFYLMKSDYDSSFYYLNLLKSKFDENTPYNLKMDYYNNLGVIYEEWGQLENANLYYSKAIEIGREHYATSDLLVFLRNKSSILYQQGKFKESRDVLKEQAELKDSLLSLEKIQIMKELEKEYESSKQRERIIQLENDRLENELNLEQTGRTRDIVALGLFIVLVIAIALYRRLKYVRKSKYLVERAKKRSDDLLLNILPVEVAEELKVKGKTQARYHQRVSVLFTDFEKFTEFTQLLSAEELVEEIDGCFKGFDEIMSKHGVEKIKTIGDSYMAAGGVPLDNEGAAERTILAALEMQVFLGKRYNERIEKGLPALRMRSGIHTGTVVAGIVGVKKFQYDIWGDTVNTASRMESYGDVGKVNISGTTYELVKANPKFKFEERGLIDVKGKGEIEMYYVSLVTS